MRPDHPQHHRGETPLALCLGGLQQRVVEQLQQPPGLRLHPVQRLQALPQLAGEDGRLDALARDVAEEEDRTAVGQPVRAVEVTADAQSGLGRPVGGAPLHPGGLGRLHRHQARLEGVGHLGLVAVEQRRGQGGAGPRREGPDQLGVGLVVPPGGAPRDQQHAGRGVPAGQRHHPGAGLGGGQAGQPAGRHRLLDQPVEGVRFPAVQPLGDRRAAAPARSGSAASVPSSGNCWTAPGWPSCWPWTAPPTATPARWAEVAPGAARPLSPGEGSSTSRPASVIRTARGWPPDPGTRGRGAGVRLRSR